MTGDVNGPDRWTLAGEYVLGTLRGARRRAFRTALERDAGLQPVVSWWEDRLLGLNAAVSPVEPDPETWFRIVQAIGEPAVAEAPPVRRRPAGARLWNSLALWRGLTFAAVLAALLAALLAQPRPALIAVLQAPDQAAEQAAGRVPEGPAFAVRVEGRQGEARVTPVGALEPGSDHAFELWAVPAGAAPVPLGLLDRVRPTAVPADRFQSGLTLAVSREPAGGSPTGQPTGPVLYTGTLVAAR